MRLRHKVKISVMQPNGSKDDVLQGGSHTIRSRLLNFLLGEKMNILVISPGDSVETVEIKEIEEEGGVTNEQN